LTTDTWTSVQNMNYMCITGHFIDPSWKYQKRILAFRQVSDHNGLTIARELEQCLEEWGIRGILTISLDNASANETAVDCFKKRTMANKDVICRNQFIHVRCCAHIINLIVHEGLKDVDDSIVRVRNMVKYIKGSPQRLAIFKSCAERKTSGYHASLTLDVPTRWNSTYMMLDVAEKYEMAFELMLDEDLNFANYLCEDGGGRKGLGPPLEDDWKNIRNFSKFLQVFYEVTVEISGSLYSTSNIYFNILQKVYNCLMEYCDSDDYLLSSMAIKMKIKYDKYWGDFEKINPLLFVASVLDPRYKMVILEFWFTSNVGEEKAKKITTKLKNALEQLYDHYDKNVGVGGSRDGLSNEEQSCGSSASMPLDAARAAHAGRNRKDALKDFHSFRASKNLLLCQTEIERYFAEDVEPPCDTFDALMWWKINSGKFPVLSEVARDVLAIPITTVASESTFSTGGRVIDPFRSSLAPKTVEALICTQNWLRSSWVSEHDELRHLHQTTLEDEDSYKLDLGNVNHICSLFQLFDSIDFLLILLKFHCLEIMSDSITFDN